MARRAKVTAFATIGQQIFVTAVLTAHPSKTEIQMAALQAAIDHIGDIGPPEIVARCIAFLPVDFQLLKMILCAAIIAAGLRVSGPVDADIEMQGG